MGLDQADTYRRGILWGTSKQDRSYFVLPQVLGLDGVWRNILREVLDDFPQPLASGDQTVPPITPEPNGHPLPGAQSAARATGIPGGNRMEGMDAPFASGPVELFERLDNETVASAAAAASEGLVLTTLDKAVNWARKNSIWPMSFGLACCAIEMMSMSASRFDIARFGAEVFRGSPRQSDLIIIAGRVSNKMAPVIRHLYQQMPEPKWAISMGACATSTGVFNNYALIPVNQVIPIDVYVPGCPPRPEQLIQALMMLQSKIQNESGTVRQILNLG